MSMEIEKGCPEAEIINNNISSTEVQWGIIEGNLFYPTTKTTKTLPSGNYELVYNRQINLYCLKYKKIITEKIFNLPNFIMEQILKDVESFWGNEKSYKKYEIIYKRGILLYGPPGCGKTCIIEYLSNQLIKKLNGIVIYINEPDSISNGISMIESIKKIEPNRKLICVFEDIDIFTTEKSWEKSLISFLDGNTRTNNIISIATTNYPEKLKERISNRPSRFDRRYEIGIPSPTIRKYFIEQIIKKEDLNKIKINSWIKDTEGFTIDHLKELIISVFVLGHKYNNALEDIKNIKESGTIRPTIITDGPKKISGFTN